MFKHYLLNLRPYSWVDFILLGWLAKFWVNNHKRFLSGRRYPATLGFL